MGANVAKGKTNDDINIPMSMFDSKSMTEYFTELFCYAPFILQEGI